MKHFTVSRHIVHSEISQILDGSCILSAYCVYFPVCPNLSPACSRLLNGLVTTVNPAVVPADSCNPTVVLHPLHHVSFPLRSLPGNPENVNMLIRLIWKRIQPPNSWVFSYAPGNPAMFAFHRLFYPESLTFYLLLSIPVRDWVIEPTKHMPFVLLSRMLKR